MTRTWKTTMTMMSIVNEDIDDDDDNESEELGVVDFD